MPLTKEQLALFLGALESLVQFINELIQSLAIHFDSRAVSVLVFQIQLDDRLIESAHFIAFKCQLESI